MCVSLGLPDGAGKSKEKENKISHIVKKKFRDSLDTLEKVYFSSFIYQ